MSERYLCGTERRRIKVRDLPGTPLIHGIDYVEVYTGADFPAQTVLLVVCLRDLPVADWTGAVTIEGGERIPDPEVTAAARAIDLPAIDLPSLGSPIPASLAPRTLVVRVEEAGDFSDYTLRIRFSPTAADAWDPALAAVRFNFKVDCPSDFDCAPATGCAEEPVRPPELDYLARDYASFRRLMLDRLSTVLPAFTETNPADLGVTLVEVLAYAADQLAYFQDAVATEAYLGTARRRVSVRRHARLLDYAMHDGCNARTWIQFCSDQDLPSVPRGTKLLGRGATTSSVLPTTRLDEVTATRDPVVFETMYASPAIKAAQSWIPFHTWGEDDCCLPAGATRATLAGKVTALGLAAGDLLLLEEVAGSEPGVPADPSRRWVVRLTKVGRDPFAVPPDPTPTRDPVDNVDVTEIVWASADALPFPLRIGTVGDGAGGLLQMSVARGNLVLADHGRTVTGVELDPAQAPATGRYRPRLRVTDPTSAVRLPVGPDGQPDIEALSALPASTLLDQVPASARAAVSLSADGVAWGAVPDLLGSTADDALFVVETESDGRAWLRFGDGVLGRAPPALTPFTAACRVGGGAAGNVGADALTTIVSDGLAAKATTVLALGVPLDPIPAGLTVRNPLPARGGVDREDIEVVRAAAPQAFRVQERAVTEADWAEILERHPQVQRAVATRRWTGSWYTWFLSVDPKGTGVMDEPLRAELEAWIERHRLAGYDAHLDGPDYVPLDVELHVCVKPNYLRSAVKLALLRRLGRARLPDGRLAVFHPDNYTFGQPVFQSRIVAAVMEEPGVAWAEMVRLRRWTDTAGVDLPADGILRMSRTEVARCDNDPNARERGLLTLDVEGGL